MRNYSGGEGGGGGTKYQYHSVPAVITSELPSNHPYFTEFTATKGILYGVAAMYVIGVGIVSVIEVFLDIPCDDVSELNFENPAYDGSQCPHIRHWILLGLTTEECSFARRLVASILMGGFIGWERRQADRPAGIRTMALVSLGSCLFTIDSTFAFINGPMNWDASRISAAIPSGVGFLGAGLIFKKEDKETASMVVHGLTTAASVWLSAAVGIACGGELYFAASFGVALMMLLLRFGPRSADNPEHEDDGSDDGAKMPIAAGNASNSEFGNLIPIQSPTSGVSVTKKNDGKPVSMPSLLAGLQDVDPEAQINQSFGAGEAAPILTASERQRPSAKSIRKRPALASLV